MALEALNAKECTITIVDADKAVDDASAEVITLYTTSFEETGGDEDQESVPVFGGGNFDKDLPRDQVEISYDAIIAYTKATVLSELKWGAKDVNGIVDSSNSAPTKAIYMYWTNSTSDYTITYNNVKAVSWNPAQTADDFLKGTLTFKLSPTTPDGTGNRREGEVAPTDVNISWA